MSDSPKLILTKENKVARITFNRPARRNALDDETLRLLADAMREVAEDDSRVVVLTGAGDSFCSGADLTSLRATEIANFDVTKNLRETTNSIVLAMRALPKPIIARVHGHAVGAGANFALACDIIIASEQANFGQLFIKIGLMPDGGGTYFLPRTIGYAKAFELMATGEIIRANEALSLGMINRVVAFEQLDATVDAFAARLAQSPAVALANIKAGLNHNERALLAAALDFEAVHQADCFHSPDFIEGVTAFIEKRAPIFNKT